MLSGSNFSMVPTPTLFDIPLNRKSKMAAVKRKFPYPELYLARKKISKAYIILSGTTDVKKCRATLDASLTTMKSNMVADKSGVVITSVVY
jgi:hypothetical protein